MYILLSVFFLLQIICIFVMHLLVNENRCGVYVKETTLPGWKCRLKATHWSSNNDEEIFITQGRLQKHHFTQVQQRSCLYIYCIDIRVVLAQCAQKFLKLHGCHKYVIYTYSSKWCKKSSTEFSKNISFLTDLLSSYAFHSAQIVLWTIIFCYMFS